MRNALSTPNSFPVLIKIVVKKLRTKIPLENFVRNKYKTQNSILYLIDPWILKNTEYDKGLFNTLLKVHGLMKHF